MNAFTELKFEDINIGDEAYFDREITEKDIDQFGQMSGDKNPLHIDQNYASTTEFGSRIVHGMFLGALVSRLVGMELPGKYALLLKESLEFKNPVHIGDNCRIKGKVVFKSIATQVIELVVEISVGEKICVSGSVHLRVLQ